MDQIRREEYLDKFIKLIREYAEDEIPVIQIKNLIKHIASEQDRDTRHAIAEKLVENATQVQLSNGNVDDVIGAYIAEGTAMNTSAL